MFLELIPYESPRGTIHDLGALSALDSARCHILCVSDRTLYILANLAALDVGFQRRYARVLNEDGYYAVQESDEEFDIFLDVVNKFRLEVQEMDCDIKSGLIAIAEAMEKINISLSCGGAGTGGGAGPLPCIQDYDNEGLLGPPDASHGNPSEDPPPDGFATWAEYFDYKCKAAEFIWSLERKHMVALRNFDLLTLSASIVGPIIAGLVGVLPAAMTPAGFVVFVSSVVAIGIVSAASWWYMDEMVDWWDDNHEDIVCSLFNSGTSVAAVSALANALEDAIQAIVTWGVLEPVADQIAELLSTAFAQLAGNGIVEPLFKTVVAATQFEADCTDCESGDADLFFTRQYQPYNVLILGDDITANANDAVKGWQVQNSGTQIYCYFTPPVNISDWHWQGYISSPDHPGTTKNMVAHLDIYQSEQWVSTGKSWGPTQYNADLWNFFEFDVTDYALEQDRPYRLQLTLQDYNDYAWWRAIQIYSI